MMKPFETYQHLEGEPLNERDKQEVGSNFWNEGKWNTFVAPFLPDNCDGMTLIDMGCNAGLHLKMAEDRGFSHVIGVDSNKGAVKKGNDYRIKLGRDYQILHKRMEDCLDDLPVSDYTLLINAHYYFGVADWLEYLDKLIHKTVNCIVVTAKKHPVFDHTSSDPDEIRKYFEYWYEVGFMKDGPNGTEKHAREMTGLYFQSKLERVPVKDLDNGNRQQRGFLQDIDRGKPYKDTEYYRRFFDYRVTKGKWTVKKLDDFFSSRVSFYEDVKKNGLLKPIVVKKSNKRIVDGNHRHDILRHLGVKTIIVRWVL